MIGNDIVDLQQARQESDWRRPRYLEKIFTPEEQQQLAEAEDKDLLVWLLWSCKEAAYKRWASQSQQRRFLPKKIKVANFQQVQERGLPTSEVDPQEVRQHYTCSVRIIDHCYMVYTTLKDDLIHSWTLAEGQKLLLREVALFGQKDLSAATRSLLLEHLTKHFLWSPTDIIIQKNEHGRPFVYYQKEKCNLSLSIAHHGRYGGFLLAEGEGLENVLDG